jgi:hypothetical protein
MRSSLGTIVSISGSVPMLVTPKRRDELLPGGSSEGAYPTIEYFENAQMHAIISNSGNFSETCFV